MRLSSSCPKFCIPIYTFIITLVFLSACNAEPSLSVSYKPPFAPLEFTIDTNGNISIHGDPSVITPVGQFSLGLGVQVSREDDLLLIVRDLRKSAAEVDTIYRIDTRGTSVVVIVNGKTTVSVNSKTVIIDVTSGEVMSIVLSSKEYKPISAPIVVPCTSGPTDGGKDPLARAMDGEFRDTKVTISGHFINEDAIKFNNSMAEFEEVTGIDIKYEGVLEFETTISTRVDSGDAPDIAAFPGPLQLAHFVNAGKVVDVSTFLYMDWMQSHYNQSWLDMATLEGPCGPSMAGVWYRFYGKSLVWYPKDDFDAAGYTVPTTWDELMELTQLIADNGDTPWCIGIESGAATGWPATDWMEEIMLRTTTLENYDAWTRGQLRFSSPEVKNAAEIMSKIWLNDTFVYGGHNSIPSTFFGDAPNPMFYNPPKCWLHMQGSFIRGFFPAGYKANVDYGFFYLPPIDKQYGRPFVVAGDIMAMFNDRPEVRAVMAWLTTGESVRGWLAAGGAVSPHMDTNLDWYGDDVERGIAEMVQQSTSIRYDSSDLMPNEVGAGSFWKFMTDYIAGTVDLDTALQEIDSSWAR